MASCIKASLTLLSSIHVLAPLMMLFLIIDILGEPAKRYFGDKIEINVLRVSCHSGDRKTFKSCGETKV